MMSLHIGLAMTAETTLLHAIVAETDEAWLSAAMAVKRWRKRILWAVVNDNGGGPGGDNYSIAAPRWAV